MTARSITRRSAVSGGGAGVLAIGLGSRGARAQAGWPSQAIKLVVPFTPGGSTDLLARIVGQSLERALGQPVVIENRPGSGGSIAATQVARAEPDGHTLLMGHIGTLAFNASLYPSLSYDPRTSFSAVAFLATIPNILAVHPAVPARTVGELIAHAKANPGKLNYGSGGNGSAAHIATGYFAYKAGIDLVHVPYRGTAPAVNDLIGGHIQMMLTGAPIVLPQASGGQVRAIAISSRTRAPFAPDLPTIAESGLPGFEAVQWHGVVAPAGTPEPVIRRLNTEINAMLTSPELVKSLENEGAFATPMTPAAFAAHIASELELWRGVIRDAGIRLG